MAPQYAKKYSSHLGVLNDLWANCLWKLRVIPRQPVRKYVIPKRPRLPHENVNGAARQRTCMAIMNPMYTLSVKFLERATSVDFSFANIFFVNATFLAPS